MTGIAEDSLRSTGDGIFQHIVYLGLLAPEFAGDRRYDGRDPSAGTTLDERATTGRQEQVQQGEGCKSILLQTVNLLLQALSSRRRSHVVENVTGDKNEFTGSCFGNGLGTLHHEIAVADEECLVAARNFAVFFDTLPDFDFDFLKPGVDDLGVAFGGVGIRAVQAERRRMHSRRHMLSIHAGIGESSGRLEMVGGDCIIGCACQTK